MLLMQSIEEHVTWYKSLHGAKEKRREKGDARTRGHERERGGKRGKKERERETDRQRENREPHTRGKRGEKERQKPVFAHFSGGAHAKRGINGVRRFIIKQHIGSQVSRRTFQVRKSEFVKSPSAWFLSTSLDSWNSRISR